jgi:hypothetical protein
MTTEDVKAKALFHSIIGIFLGEVMALPRRIEPLFQP